MSTVDAAPVRSYKADFWHNRPDAEVLWVYRRKRLEGLRQWERGERPSDMYYGLMEFDPRFRVGFIEEDEGGRSPLLRPVDFLESRVSRRMGAGFAYHIALRHLRLLRRAKVVVSTGDVCGLPVALLKKLGLLRCKLIYITHGLSDHVRRFGARRWLPRFYKGLLLRHADHLVALSEGGRRGLADWLGVPPGRIACVPYGTDTDFWRNTATARRAGNEIVSVGSDSGRDFDTLLRACADFPLHLVSERAMDLRDAPRARRTTDHSFRELRDIYSNARFVVVSLHDRDQPSGQSTGLQAMSCGKALIVTRTRGWWGEDLLRDGENCLTVPPGNALALRAAVKRLWDDPALCERLGAAARATAAAHFSEKRMLDALLALIESSLGRP